LGVVLKKPEKEKCTYQVNDEQQFSETQSAVYLLVTNYGVEGGYASESKP
jgi:hypothetical protein